MNPKTAVAQLRHLYKQLLAGEVRDTAQAARGLLGPAIEALESAEAERDALRQQNQRPQSVNESGHSCTMLASRLNQVEAERDALRARVAALESERDGLRVALTKVAASYKLADATRFARLALLWEEPSRD